ncbi:MAG TPA: tetratricopeptide repeat protein [Bryobacteraceae bacterium]|jgi:tetratricopeptide (TPR) repeat protein
MLLVPVLWLLAPPVQPSAAAAHERQGRAYEAKGDLDKAAAEYDQALRGNPYEESYYYESAHVRLVRQQFEEAVAVLERGCKTFDKSAQLRLALGVAYYGERRFPEAADAFLRTIDLAPEVQQPYVFLSKMLDQTVDRLPAILPRFKAWAAANPNDPQAQFVYAKGLLASGADTEGAEQLLRTSIRLKGDQWESHYELGVLLEKQRKFADAAVELGRSAALAPKQADVHYHLSRVYDRMGESQKAAEEREVHARLTSPGEVK